MKPRTALKILCWMGVCAALGMGTHATAQQVYKCLSVSGKVRYADEPCAKSDHASKVSIQPNVLGTVDPRDTLLRREAKRLAAQDRIAEQSAPLPVAVAAPIAASASANFDGVACQRARRDYEVTASSSANTRAIVEAKRSMMYGACGQREPDVHRTVIIQSFENAPLRGGAYAIFP